MSWVLVGCLAVAGYLGLGLAFTLLAWRNPKVAPRRTPGEMGFAYEDVRFPTASGKTLHGWLVVGAASGKPPVILVHGWGRNAERMLPYLAFLVPAGYPALAFDARHHGLSDRDRFASMKKFSEDIQAAASFLEARGFSPPFPVIGLSIGGSAAIHAAAHDPRLGPVVTVGAFAHPRDAMIALGFGRYLFAPLAPLLFRFMEWRVGAKFDVLAPEANIAKLAAPCLLIHGQQDTVVPVSHAHRLAAASRGKAILWLLPRRGHSDVHLEPGFARAVLAFLEHPGSFTPPSEDRAVSGASGSPAPAG